LLSLFVIGQESLSLQHAPPIEHFPSLQQSAIPHECFSLPVSAVAEWCFSIIGQLTADVCFVSVFAFVKANATTAKPKTSIAESAIKNLFFILFTPCLEIKVSGFGQSKLTAKKRAEAVFKSEKHNS